MNAEYLGTAFQIGERYLINLDLEKVQKIEPNEYGRFKFDIVRFLNPQSGKTSHSVYLQDEKRQKNAVETLQADHKSLLEVQPTLNKIGKEVIRLVSDKKLNIQNDKMDRVLYVNKFTEEVKKMTDEEKGEVLKQKPEYIGGGWTNKYYQEKEGKEKTNIMSRAEEEVKEREQEQQKSRDIPF